MITECNHNWKKLYFRKMKKNKEQQWTTIKDKFVCDKCMEIKELK